MSKTTAICLFASVVIIAAGAISAHLRDQRAIVKQQREIRHLQRQVAWLSQDENGNVVYGNEAKEEPGEECISWIQ